MADTVWDKAGLEYDVLALHARYDREKIQAVMGDNAKYVTMLRDPVDLFESAYEYYRMYRKFGMTLGNISPQNISTNDFPNEV